MSFILDQNISFRVASMLAGVFDNVKHVKQLGLVDASDIEIWQYAKTNDYTIITFDSDFIDFSILRSFPPKIIWLRFGNSTNFKIVNKLIANQEVIEDFVLNKTIAFLEID